MNSWVINTAMVSAELSLLGMNMFLSQTYFKDLGEIRVAFPFEIEFDSLLEVRHCLLSCITKAGDIRIEALGYKIGRLFVEAILDGAHVGRLLLQEIIASRHIAVYFLTLARVFCALQP